MRRINLYGGPGVGKSTLAARLFAELKKHNANVELVQEFVKQYVYLGRRMTPWDCVHTFACQLEAEYRYLKWVDVVISDSPLPLQCVYARKHKCPSWRSLLKTAMDFENEYPSLNFWIPRATHYEPKGRWETLEEAEQMDRLIEGSLTDWEIPYRTIQPNNIDKFMHFVKSNIFPVWCQDCDTPLAGDEQHERCDNECMVGYFCDTCWEILLQDARSQSW